MSLGSHFVVGDQQIVSDLDLQEISEVKLEESKEHIVIVSEIFCYYNLYKFDNC